MTPRYPRPLRQGDAIGITAPSAGVAPDLHPRLDLVLGHLRARGFVVIEGQCLRNGDRHVSAPAAARAQEFMEFWDDERIAAILPPWGGETLVEILPLLDFDRLGGSAPKWVAGFSDISTLLFALTTRTHCATIHGANLMDLAPTQTDPLTLGLIPALMRPAGESWTQQASAKHQIRFTDYQERVDAPFNLTEPTRWKALQPRFESGVTFRGRMIGGCLDTIARLVGTPYGALPAFRGACGRDGTILYFENCELSPYEVTRTLWQLRLAGWFEGLSGVLVGRSSAPDPEKKGELAYPEALASVLGDLPVPVVYDADIGHRPPQLAIVNGAVGELVFAGQGGSLTQTLR